MSGNWFQFSICRFMWNLEIEVFLVQLCIWYYRIKVLITKSSYYFLMNFLELGSFFCEFWRWSSKGLDSFCGQTQESSDKVQVERYQISNFENWSAFLRLSYKINEWKKSTKNWKHFQVVLNNEGGFENWKQNLSLNMFQFWVFKKNENENWK